MAYISGMDDMHENAEFEADLKPTMSELAQGSVTLPVTCLNALETLSSATLMLTAEHCRCLKGPIVYAYLREGSALYVGMSTIGMSRPIQNPFLDEMQRGDFVLIWICHSQKTARELEQRLIAAFRPKLNKATPIYWESCDECGNPLQLDGPSRGSPKKYCSQKCRTRAYRRRKEVSED